MKFIEASFPKHVFEFSKDDSRLFCMASYYDPRRIEALVFALNDKEPQIFSEAWIELLKRCELDNVIERILIDVCSDENTAWIINKDKIYQVDFSPPNISFPRDLITDLNPYIHYSRISSDGTKLSVLRYGDDKVQIQMFDLNIPGNPVRCLDLDWPNCESETLKISFSRDLSVLICGENLYHLAAEDCLASKYFRVFSPAPGQETFGRKLSGVHNILIS